MKAKFQIKLLILVSLLVLASCGVNKSLRHRPQTAGYDPAVPIVKKHSPTWLSSGKNTLQKNQQGLWELYVEGDPLQIGLLTGSLEDSLLKKQERVFFSKVEELVPSASKQKLLRKLLTWYNRKLYLHVPEVYKTEIYGLSRYSSPNYDFIAPPYLRSLYLHGAHDIGHAMQDLALVGCSSFAAWGDKSEDGTLILGRNFDFYAGDDFAKDKVVAFVKPDRGYPFMSVSWPGMIGVVSGMNLEGLTVTINAGKSKIPLVAKTPISILTREILQYAKNIEEAIAIAKRREVFVSESIMVGSARDNQAVLIEVAPGHLGVYAVPNSNNQLICSNHFQSEALKNDKRNLYQIENSHSQYRFEKLTEELAENPKINPEIAAKILRDREGLDDKPIGYGNEKALNQLLAHHGVIFKPEQKLVWVSGNPYQMGEMVCYDLNKIFDGIDSGNHSFAENSRNIPPDPFLQTQAYKNYEQFRIEDRKMDAFLENKTGMAEDFAKNYQSLNPDFWLPYYKTGTYYFENKQYEKAKADFEKALTKEITTLPAKKEIDKKLRKINRKL